MKCQKCQDDFIKTNNNQKFCLKCKQTRHKDYGKDYYLKNQENYRLYRKNHKDDIKAYKQDHKDKDIIYRENFKKKHGEDYLRERWKKQSIKRRQNQSYRILSNLRKRIYRVLHGTYKSKHTKELIGCSLEQLKQHLQETALKNGYKGFNINTYSGKDYHIDHIIPCSAWNLKCSYHQKLCFNWSNLQILKAEENIRKGDKLCTSF